MIKTAPSLSTFKANVARCAEKNIFSSKKNCTKIPVQRTSLPELRQHNIHIHPPNTTLHFDRFDNVTRKKRHTRTIERHYRPVTGFDFPLTNWSGEWAHVIDESKGCDHIASNIPSAKIKQYKKNAIKIRQN